MKTPENTSLILSDAARKTTALLLKEKITQEDLLDLDERERALFFKKTNKIFSKLKGVERDAFWDKIELVVHQQTRNMLWEVNHAKITHSISALMEQYRRMPTKQELAEHTGLSRLTISRHIRDYKAAPQYLADWEQFRFMTSKVLATVFSGAVKGDVKAARLYFEMVGAQNQQTAGTVINEQNNYIQINNTVLNQETLKRLSNEQLNQIELIVNKGLLQETKMS